MRIVGLRREARNPVAEAAALLDVPEIEVFARAHRWWFGRPAAPARLERAFVPYMFAGRTPPWARQYAREVLHDGAAAPRRLGPAPEPLPPPRRPRLTLGITAAVFALLYVALLDTAAHWPDDSRPAPAPLHCTGGGPGLAFLESLGFAFAGRTPPPC